MYTIIDSDNYGANGIETMFFPAGEPHAKIPESLKGDVLLFLKLRNWLEVGQAACVLDALARKGSVTPIAFIPYFPAGRQDKDTNGLAPRTIDLMHALLSTDFIPTYTFDRHSEETLGHNLMPSDMHVPISEGIVGVIAPDRGAFDRAANFRNTFYPEATLIECTKSRDPISGRLSNYSMPPLEKTGGYIIVDDICDGGGTFNLLAEAFDRDSVGRASWLHMFVSHGIFSKGLHVISPRISKIITTNSWCRRELLKDSPWNRVTVLPLEQLFHKIIGE